MEDEQLKNNKNEKKDKKEKKAKKDKKEHNDKSERKKKRRKTNKKSERRKDTKIMNIQNDEDEDNDCEELIKYHRNVSKCLLMTNGYRSVQNKYYFCTCDPDCQMPLCLACISGCHYLHWAKYKKLEDMFVDTRTVLCCCGLKNHILPDNVKVDFVYDIQCQFLEWSVTTKTYIFYEDPRHPDEILCMFCYNLCKNKPENYLRKSDDVLCHRLNCCNTHEDYISIFDKLGEITKETSFQFESFTGIQFLNMVIMSQRSFDNSFHKLLGTLKILSYDVLKENKKKFDFTKFINNSPFMKAIERLDSILNVCKNLFYTTDIIDVSNFIFPFLQRKFNYKSQENIWLLKRNVFTIYHKLNFRKDFEVLPLLSVRDFANLNPYQRYLYCDYIKQFDVIENTYFDIKHDDGYQKNHVDENLRTLEKYKIIKDKGEYAYEILRTTYSEIKKIARFNKMSNEQAMKFFSLNDDIILNSLNSKNYLLKCGLSQMRMLYQMVECIIYIVYYYNDNQIKKYLKNEIELNQISFFHGNNETAKMIYKNTTHIVLYCRTIHQNYVIEEKNKTQEVGNMQSYADDKINITEIKNKIDKFHKKIMFMTTEIISLTLNNDDFYIFGLRTLLKPESEIYSYVYNGVFLPKEEEIINDLKKMCLEIEEVYQSFFQFEIKNEDVENCIINKIKQFFILIGKEPLKLISKTTLYEESERKGELVLKRKRKKTNVLLNYLQNVKRKDKNSEENQKIRILINKTPFMFTIIKSLEMLLTMNVGNVKISQSYADCLFSFLNYYVENCADNCLLIMSERVIKSFLMLNTEYLVYFINLLEYMIKTLLFNKRQLSQNNTLMKVVTKIIERISDKSEYIYQFQKLLKIIDKLSQINYLYQEHTMDKIRKTLKNIYAKNPIFTTFKKLLIPKQEGKTINQMINDKDVIGHYTVETMTVLFTKFLKLVNYMFDGNSTLNESEFLSSLFKREEIPEILKDLTIYLPLRTQLITFFRISYMDIIIDSSKMQKYLSIFTEDIHSEVNENSTNFVLFQELLRVNEHNCFNSDIDCELLISELKNFPEIIKNSSRVSRKKVVEYFVSGIILPLTVFINTYISIIYTLNGYQYIKLYQLVLYFLLSKVEIIKELTKFNSDIDKNVKNSFFKVVSYGIQNKYVYLLKVIQNESLSDINEDLYKLVQRKKIEILNYKYIYNLFIKHSSNFTVAEKIQHLDEIFSKKNGGSDEYYEEKRLEYKNKNEVFSIHKEKLFNIWEKYEKDKINFGDSALSQNLSEKNVIFDSTYRQIMLRPIFFLINSGNLYIKYRKQNLWHIFRLLQCDTNNTQKDMLEIYKEDIENVKKNSPKANGNVSPVKENNDEKTFKSSLTSKSDISKSVSKEEKTNVDEEKKDNNLENSDIDLLSAISKENNLTIDINYLVNLFTENLLSIIFSSCNPSTISGNEDYMIAYMIIKTMKYMCEDHNLDFQTIFFKEIKIKYDNSYLNIFELMMCTLDKVLILSKWDEVNYESDENKIIYFYDIYFCMIELAIEMIQGTSKENSLSIINQPGRKNENSYFYRFLLKSSNILHNNDNDSEVLYNVRINIVSFLQAFIEEKSTPRKTIMLLENLLNPISIFETIIITLKKLYMKSINSDVKKYSEIEFDQEKSKLFIEKYFSDNEFSKNPEFELSNNMYHYVKALANYKNKDAVNIIECTKIFTEQEILNLKKTKNTQNLNENSENEGILIDPRYFQIYFAVKFFEAITRGVWIQSENDKNPQFVLFTLDPTVLFLSQDSKNNFINDVPRDTRSSKLFSLMEYTNYFFIEINQNKKKLSSNYFWRILNKINYNYIDYFIFFISCIINIILFIMAESKDDRNEYKNIYKTIFPIGLIQLLITFSCLVIWMLHKFSLFYTIEKEKYYIRHHYNKTEKLSLFQYLDIILLNTILSRREIVNFVWYLIFGLLGVSSSKLLFSYSIQILIVVNIISTLQSIAHAIVMRYKQLLTFLMFLIVCTYIFSTIAFFTLSKDFIHVNEGNQENTCGSLMFCFLTHLEFGLRTDGGIGEYISKLSLLESPLYFMWMFFFQFIFYILIIVIMLAVIGGSVIDTFAELRDKSREDYNDFNNICFICNGHRNEIEKGGERFEEHTKNVHSIWNYVDYMIGLKFVDPQETNAINSFVIEQLQDKKISWFPSFVEKDDFQKVNENSDEEEESVEKEK